MSFPGLIVIFYFLFLWQFYHFHVLQFIPLPTEGHLGGFQILAVMNEATVNIPVQVLCSPKFSTLLGKYQGT